MVMLDNELREFLDNLQTSKLKFEATAVTPVSFVELKHTFDIVEQVNDEEPLYHCFKPSSPRV